MGATLEGFGGYGLLCGVPRGGGVLGHEGIGGRACSDAGWAVEARPSGRREGKMARDNGRVAGMCGRGASEVLPFPSLPFFSFSSFLFLSLLGLRGEIRDTGDG